MRDLDEVIGKGCLCGRSHPSSHLHTGLAASFWPNLTGLRPFRHVQTGSVDHLAPIPIGSPIGSIMSMKEVSVARQWQADRQLEV